jgi:hypothetical protein
MGVKRLTHLTHTKQHRAMKAEKLRNPLIEKALAYSRQPVETASARIIEDSRISAVKICSHVLDACIWFSFDPDFKPDDDEPLAVFYADEIPFISDKTVEQLKEIHQWKLTFWLGARVRQ